MIKVNCKQLKAVLALKVKKLSLLILVLKLDKFPLFDNFYSDLADFRDLNNFPVFDNFLHFSINSSPPLTPPVLLATSIYDHIVVFSIDVSGTAIILKSWMNC